MPSTPLTDAIVALTTYANTITGESDTTLSDAVESLIDGYSEIDQYEYSISNGQIIILPAGTTPSKLSTGIETDGEIVVNFYSGESGVRRSFVTAIPGDKGISTAYLNHPTLAQLRQTNLYPIRIPEDAVSVQVSITPNSQYLSIYFYTYDEINGFVEIEGSGWVEGTYTKSLTPGSMNYLSVASKYNSSGSSYATDPSDVIIKFTK